MFGSGGILVAFIGALALCVGYATWAFLRFVRLRRAARAPLAALAAASVAGLVWTRALANSQQLARPGGPESVQVSISSPTFGHKTATPSLQVKGSVQPATSNVVLAIRSESDIYWWTWSVADGDQQDANRRDWSRDVQLGDRDNGIDQNFQIIALARQTDWWCRLGLCRSGIPEGRHSQLPGWFRSQPLVVRRISNEEQQR